MSKRTRTVNWCEQRIISELAKRSVITTYLALSASVLENVRSIDEQHNLDIALVHLLSRKEITQEKDSDGFTVYKLAGIKYEQEKHILPNNTKVAIFFDGVKVGEGTITDHNVEKNGDNPKQYDLYYEVKIERTGLEMMLNLPEKHWLNAFEVKPIR